MASAMPAGPAKSTAPREGAAAADRSVAPGAVAAKPSFSGESEYEQQRRQNMARNAQMLAALGLEGAGRSFSGVKRSAEPRRAERRPIQRSRISLRHAGLGVDAVQEDVDAALLEAAASARPAPSRITERYEGGGRAEPLSEDQRDRLALAACGWLERMHNYYEPRISETNLQMVMARVRELVRGEGVALPRLEGRALEGCPVAITDDLVALREDAKVYAKWDVGGAQQPPRPRRARAPPRCARSDPTRRVRQAGGSTTRSASSLHSSAPCTMRRLAAVPQPSRPWRPSG